MSDNQSVINEEHLIFKKRIVNWQAAISLAAQPLLVDQIIEEKYIAAMIENVLKLGEYMVLVPRVALPHARPEEGALKTGFSILKLDDPVVFGKSQKVSLIICLATNNDDTHLAMLQKISTLIDEESKVDALLSTTSKTKFIELSEIYFKEEE